MFHLHISHLHLWASINQIKSNSFAQNTSQVASGKAVDEQSQQGSKEHLQ